LLPNAASNPLRLTRFAQSNDLFESTCADLFEQMLNTVPRDVQLTEIIEPLPVKPVLTMVRAANGTFMLSGSVRVRPSCGPNPRCLLTSPQFWNLDDSSDPKVSLVWAGEDGQQCNGCSVVLRHDKTFQFGISMPGNHRAPWYMFPDGGVHMGSTDSPTFWFEINQNGDKRVEDNSGNGFPLLKKVVLSDTSCVSQSQSFARFDIAVGESTIIPSIVVSDSRCRSREAPNHHAFSLKETPLCQTWELQFRRARRLISQF
jgi:hypothetical protein